MAEVSYAVLGAGRWGTRIADILLRLGRRVVPLAVPRPHGRRDDWPAQVMAALLDAGGSADVVWLAIPPADQETALRCVLEVGRHAVVEKPWMADAATTGRLARTAADAGRHVAVHHQYCYLDALPALAAEFAGDGEVEFSGAFTIARGDRLGIPALFNLGSHLAAIRQRHFPWARVTTLSTAYRAPDARWIALDRSGVTRRLDFSGSREPLVERFIGDFEAAVSAGRRFPLDLEFGAAAVGLVRAGTAEHSAVDRNGAADL